MTTPGPVETLALLAIQSQRYVDDPDYRDAVDAVLWHPQYDAAPALLAACEAAFERLTDNDMIALGSYPLTVQLQAAIATAKGE